MSDKMLHWNFKDKAYNLVKVTKRPDNVSGYYIPEEVHYINPKLNWIVRLGVFINKIKR